MPPFPRLLLMPHFWPQTWLHMLYIYRLDFKEMEASELILASQCMWVKNTPDFTVFHEIHRANVTFFLKIPLLTTVRRWRYSSTMLSNSQQLWAQEQKASQHPFSQKTQPKLLQHTSKLSHPRISVAWWPRGYALQQTLITRPHAVLPTCFTQQKSKHSSISFLMNMNS